MEHPNTTPIEMPKQAVSQTLPEKYFRAFFLPALITAVFAVSAQFIENTFWISLIAFTGLLAYVSWKLFEDKVVPIVSFWTMFVALLIITFITAFVKLIIYFKFVYFLNLITEPLIYAIIGGALGYLVLLALSRGQKKTKPDIKPEKELINKN